VMGTGLVQNPYLQAMSLVLNAIQYLNVEKWVDRLTKTSHKTKQW